MNYHLAKSLRAKSTVERMQQFPDSRRIYQRDGRFYEAGEILVQPELAGVLARIKQNPRDFYEGDTARLIVSAMKANGGIITAEDLRTYEPTIREPLRGTYRGHEIITMPPPSSGGIALIEMLQMLEAWDLKSMGWHSSRHVHTFIEVMRRAFADRAEFLGDTDFVNVPVASLVSRAYADQRRSTIDPEHATPSKGTPAGKPESTETTHYTIVDQDGNVVSNTYTLNDSYGSGATVRGGGFLLNDEMDDFAARPGMPNDYELIQGEANAIAPKKRPLSSMTPTIVVKDGKVRFAIGSPGGPTIINTVLHVITDIIDFDMTMQEAIDAPRFHHQWLPDQIYWEEYALQSDTRAALERMGHKFREQPGFSDSSTIGDAHGIVIDPQTGMRLGASDPRRGGAAVGW